jgi:ferric-dicitrate binding protein FerR (iron transport regulator)
VTNRSCEQVQDLLVDYADGELSEQDSQAATEHLAECPTCREIVRGLERSLHLAEAIWLDNLEAAKTASAHQRVVRLLPWAAVAAAILIVAGTFLLNSVRRPAEPEYARIERQVASVATAARLLAATQILATCEGTESIVKEQYHYILNNYADTPAAATLRNGNHFRRILQ